MAEVRPTGLELAGMLEWCQENIDRLSEIGDPDVTALHSALMTAVRPDGGLDIDPDDEYDRHRELWAVVLRIAERYNLRPDTEGE